MPRAGLTTAKVVSAAAEMVDEVGWAQLTLAGLAQKLGVRQPSLYKHVDSLESLRVQVAVLAKSEIAERLAAVTVGKARDEALLAMAHEYRRWAHEHPGIYQAAQRSPSPGDDESEAVTDRAVTIMAAVMAGYGLAGDDAIDAIRAFRAATHGFVSLELGGGLTYSRDLDASYERLIRLLATALAGWTTPVRPADAQAGGTTGSERWAPSGSNRRPTD